MPRSAIDDGLTKHQRYRENRRASGMKLLRMWVPDVWSPEFQAEAKRQAALLRGSRDEAEAMDFIERVADYGDE